MVVIPPDFQAKSVYIALMNSVFRQSPKCCRLVAKKFVTFGIDVKKLVSVKTANPDAPLKVTPRASVTPWYKN